jgi:hypothetical protein
VIRELKQRKLIKVDGRRGKNQKPSDRHTQNYYVPYEVGIARA